MLAGALALAACGGGSNNPTASSGGGGGNGGGDNGANNGANTSSFKAITIPGGYTLEDADEGNTGQLRAGDSGNFGPRGKGVTVSCPEGATDGCRWRVKDGLIEATGGATGELWKLPSAPTADTADRTGGVTGGTDWLSNRNLIRSVKVDGSDNVYIEIEAPNGAPVRLTDQTGDTTNTQINVGGSFSDADPDHDVQAGSRIKTAVIDTGGGRETDLRLIHTRHRTINAETGHEADRERQETDYLVYGAWERRTAAGDSDPDAPRSEPTLGYLATGTIPRNDPQRWGIGDARYEGRALGHYRLDDARWQEWAGTVNLKANFAPEEGLIRGTLKTGLGEQGGGSLEDINLGQTKIGASVSGDATVKGTASTGTWNAGFYGTAVNGQPTGVAGSFAVNRTGDEENEILKADVQGAFGAHNVGQIAD